ncbi:MAG: fluoride efflux transporter CrcB [Bacteroidetes bacterium]|jgi:CrcB protein|nr:fluoride efflux transporter CrcB [Bacteroidota bacterium]MBT5528587.1 fluoride efflux transporter CrcB [Cytophagia bacterium]MBT3424468.1 fluoride efflux transporter CrcB [Bacteroidota bacterium]MBT3802331.1 fluoride efflux transporter CrcB [Bacteroidota bacterium]MBT3935856.1 fluoride efflux transporter CrcB [Bacteroidota bacterium]
MVRILLFIGVGGFLGSTSRYLMHKWVHSIFTGSFPLGTMTVNIIGCFLIGIIFGLSTKGNIQSNEWKLFLTTGFCGGFTTFSAFSLENINLLKDGQLLSFFGYTGLSLVVGLGATVLGILLIKLF